MAASVYSGTARKDGRGRYRPMSEINVTPLVDVMLVLLVVFMVTAPLLTVGVPVELPQTQAPPINPAAIAQAFSSSWRDKIALNSLENASSRPA